MIKEFLLIVGGGVVLAGVAAGAVIALKRREGTKHCPPMNSVEISGSPMERDTVSVLTRDEINRWFYQKGKERSESSAPCQGSITTDKALSGAGMGSVWPDTEKAPYVIQSLLGEDHEVLSSRCIFYTQIETSLEDLLMKSAGAIVITGIKVE